MWVMATPKKTKVTEIGGQAHLDLDGLDAMELQPRCEKTGASADLHLVAYRDLDSGEQTAGILGAEYRHLVRRTTTLSVPIGILSVGSVRALEARGKIPAGSPAAAKVNTWLRHGTACAWDEVARAKSERQDCLELDDAAGLGL